MNLHIITHPDVPMKMEKLWTFPDHAYVQALDLYENMDRDGPKGLMLEDGFDTVWLEKTE